MKVKRTTHEEDLQFKSDEFLKLDPMRRLEINNLIKERIFGGVHHDWAGMKVRRVKK